jgi:hypothetical protein
MVRRTIALLHNAVEDYLDRRSVRRRAGETIPAEKLWARLGLTPDE